MEKIDDLVIRRILDTARIEDVVGSFVELKKSGARFLGLCPFHDDRHLGSFVVYPRLNCYKCFACGKGGSVLGFLEEQGMTFPDAIRWLGNKYHIDVDDVPVGYVPAVKETVELPTMVLPNALVENSYLRMVAQPNNLCRWLREGVHWDKEAQRLRVDKVLEEYKVGVSKFGHSMFWQISETGEVRTGKMMLYKPDGHRDKGSKWNFDWAHSALIRADYDLGETELQQTLFGMHLRDKYPNADVHIVESEKTALFCAIYFGNSAKDVWMASGGLNNISRKKLKPLMDKGRVIALHPDKDGVETWKSCMELLAYDKAYINTTIMSLAWKEQDGPKADLADVLVRVLDDKRRDRMTKKVAEVLPEVEPAARLLIDKFKLEETKE